MRPTEFTTRQLEAACWLVLDNLVQGWSYWTNLERELADEAYRWCVRNEYIENGQISVKGRVAIIGTNKVN